MAKNKLLFIVLDGAADGLEEGTSLDLANTPNLDELARMSRGGMHYPTGKGVAPESDSAVFNLLGYNHEKYYIGRGPVEAIGVGLELKDEYEVAFRGNLATADFKRGMIVDRRVGRDISTEEAENLIEKIKYVDLGIYGGYARVAVGLDYRLAVIIGSREYRLSEEVTNTDPAYIKLGRISIASSKYSNKIIACQPIGDSEEARITAELVNRFIEIANNALSNHPINQKRISEGKLPANTIILRDAGLRPKDIPKITKYYGIKAVVMAEMPTELGIARLIGAKVIKCKYVSGKSPEEYSVRAIDVINALENEDTDLIYVHIKGPDVYGHDGDLDGKVRNLEHIDKFFIGRILNYQQIYSHSILITMDHATPPSKKRHTGDPVPLILYSNGIGNDGLLRFYENEVLKKGSIGILGYGWMILPIVKKLIW